MTHRRLLFALPFLAACSTPIRWVELERQDSLQSIWMQFTQIASSAGFVPSPETDRGRRRYVSKWRLISSTRLFRSERARLVAEFERPESESGWRIRFHIQKQVVGDIGVGLQPTEDDWDDAGQDTTKEEILLGRLRSRFGHELGITPLPDRQR